MTVQQSKRRPLSRYLKDFKHSQTHCAHCKKLLDRITLVRRGEIVNKIAISRLAVSVAISTAKSKATSSILSASSNSCLNKRR